VLAAALYFFNKRMNQQADAKGGHMQRVMADDDTLGDDDDDDDDDDDGGGGAGDEEEADGGDDGADGEDGENGEDGDEGEGDDEGAAEDDAADGEPLTIKAFVALGDQVHSIVLPLESVESWGGLSQTIHEACEDGDVPDLPEHGIMHIVLNINGVTVPVTGKTPIDELWKAKALKVSIAAEDDEDGDAENDGAV